MSFELRDHTADVAVEATAPDLSTLFGSVADGLAAASCEEIPDDGGSEFEVTVAAENREALLFDYLDQLIYERDVRDVLPVDNQVEVDPPEAENDDGTEETESQWKLAGTARGIPLSAVDAREVKAVTYSEMRIRETDSGWDAYVVFDV
jgi:SHS2 domain-containing protein